MRILHALAALSSGVLLLGATAHAAINPAAPGLPAANAYGQVGIPNNEASAMCVDCHTRNPAVRTAPAFANGNTPTRADVNGSHYVMETPVLAHSGGGWSDDRWLGAQYKNGKYMKVSAWGLSTDPNFSGVFSKWSNGSYVSLPAWSAAAPTPITVGDYGMICESCHNIRINVPVPTGFPAGEGNRKLLAWTTNNMNDTASHLCEGCHAKMKATATAGNNDGGNFLNAQGTGRDHHVVNGDPINAALAATGRLWGKAWAWGAVTAVQMGNPVEPTSYSNYIRGDALTTGDIDFAAASSANITCSNCHRAHNAQTITGGLILKSGNGTVLSGTGTTTTTDVNYGLQRQFDRGAKEVATTKLLGNETNLCAGCHNGY